MLTDKKSRKVSEVLSSKSMFKHVATRQSTLRVTKHDAQVLAGSLNAVTKLMF